MSYDFQPMAFIDNATIKIADQDGTEYIPYLAKQKKKISILTGLMFILVLMFFTFVLAASSHVFFSWFSDPQLKFFTSCAGFSFIASIVTFAIRSKEASSFLANSSEFNRAKLKLQSKIMELEKQIAKHNTEMQQIETQAKFNFKKSQEMIA